MSDLEAFQKKNANRTDNINPLGFHCFLRDKTYNVARQRDSWNESRFHCFDWNVECVIERPFNRDDFYRVLYDTLPRNEE